MTPQSILRTPRTLGLILSLGLGAGLITVSPAQAVIVTYAGSPIAIPDATYDGTLASAASSSLLVTGQNPGTITSVRVGVGIDHDWVGDLTLKLQAPDGSLLFLLNRPGLVSSMDGDPSGGGFSGNLAFTQPIGFSDAAGPYADTLGVGFLDGQTITGGSFKPDGDGAGDDQLSMLNGLEADGLWTLYVGDSASGGTGSLVTWGLDIAVAQAPPPPPPVGIPESTTLGLIAGVMGLLSLTRRARAKRV